MSDQIESALLITLERAIEWEGALAPNGSVEGKLTVVDINAPFDATLYNRRDRELAYRDLVNATAVVKVGVELSSIFGGAVDFPNVEGVTSTVLPQIISDQGATTSQIVHIKHASLPVDALGRDMDLVGRDALIYDTLAQACQIFEEPPLAPLAQAITPVTAWSLGEALENRQDINQALPLNRDLFGNADKHLAHRDNLVAAYAARLCQVLKNPFAYATRLYVEIGEVDAREVEVYNLIRPPYVLGTRYNVGDEVWYRGNWWRAVAESYDVPVVTSVNWVGIDAPSNRIWTAEPALPDRNRIVYNVSTQRLKWYQESNDVSSVPQLFALSVPGIFEYQTVNTILSIPERKDSQFWRKKAARIVFMGTQLQDLSYVPDTTYGTHCVVADDAAVITIPDHTAAQWTLGGELLAGRRYQVSALVVPQPFLKVYGEQTVTTSRTQTISPYSTIAGPTLVDRGITFDGVYQPSETTVGASVVFSLALPSGAWQCTLDYTNLLSVTNGFGIDITTQDVSQDYATTVMSDATVLQFKDVDDLPFTNGKLVTSAPFTISSSGVTLNLSVTWSYGSGLFHLRSITFRQVAPAITRYAMEGKLTDVLANVISTGSSTLDVYGSPTHYGVMPFDFTAKADSAADASVFEMKWRPTGEADQTPLMIRQVSLHQWIENDSIPDALGFEGYRQECLDRAESNVQQAWNRMVFAYAGNVPLTTFNGTWSRATSEDWVSLAEIYEPRMREVGTILSGNITDGFQYEVTGSFAVYDEGQYWNGDTFYGTFLQSEYSGDAVKQVGAFKPSRPGHLGKLGLMPMGVVYDYQTGVAQAPTDVKTAVPHLVSLQPWMIEVGAYVAQPDFWLVDTL